MGAAGCIPPSTPGRNVGRAISPAADPCGGAWLPGRCKHRPLRNTGQGSARFCRTPPSQSGNAPAAVPCRARFASCSCYDYSSHFGASQRRTGSRPACFTGSCGRPQKAVIFRAGTELPAGTPPQPQLQTAGGPPVESTPAGRPVFELLYAAFPCCPASGGAFSPPAAQTPAERPPLRSR